MSADPQRDVTTLLEHARSGNSLARDQLVALVYDELRRLGGGLMRRERPSHTLSPTALVHEAVVRLFSPDAPLRANNRAQFLAAAARAMRRVLVDHARARAADKRERLPVDEVLDYFTPQRLLDLVAVHEALDRLAGLHARQAQIVELRFFGG